MENPSAARTASSPISVTFLSLNHSSTRLVLSSYFPLWSISLHLSLTHSQVHAVFFPPSNFVLGCFSLTALLIWPLFRSIFQNQYLISERSAGLLQYVPWRIFKTHRPRSPFNLFTQKVMRYRIGLRHTDVEPIPSNCAAFAPKLLSNNKAPDNVWHRSLIFLHLFLILWTILRVSDWPQRPQSFQQQESSLIDTYFWWWMNADRRSPLLLKSRADFPTASFHSVLPSAIHYSFKCWVLWVGSLSMTDKSSIIYNNWSLWLSLVSAPIMQFFVMSSSRCSFFNKGHMESCDIHIKGFPRCNCQIQVSKTETPNQTAPDYPGGTSVIHVLHLSVCDWSDFLRSRESLGL